MTTPGTPSTLGTLGISYHMPCWQTADGSIWEAEGSFARYVDSLAPYYREVILSVPVFDTPPLKGTRVRAANVRLAPLPYFPGPRQFYPQLREMRRRLRAWVAQCDVVHLRIPSPAAIFAFRLARATRKPVFLLVVGDYAALLPHLPYRGVKRWLFGAYVAFEEWALRYMTCRALTFANGRALADKHARQGAHVIETKTTTLSDVDIVVRTDACSSKRLRLLTVSRIDPRKGLRVLPGVVARLVEAGYDARLDIIGPPIGRLGEQERGAILQEAARLDVAGRVTLAGAVALDELLPKYREYDVFVLPTGPGEGIPRVLMEAMAGGLPVVTTRVAGIGSLIEDGRNGCLVEPTAEAIASAVAGLAGASDRRDAIVNGGYATARAHTLERQAAGMMATVARLSVVRRHICFVLPSLADGGAERVAVTVLSALDPRRFDRTLYLFSAGGVYHDLVAPDVRMRIAPRRSWPGRLIELARFLRDTRPDVVMPFLSYFITALAAWLAGGRARVMFNQGTPTSAFLNDPDFDWRGGWRRRLFTSATRFFYRRVAAVVVTSTGVADDLATHYGVPRSRLRVLPNPVDVDAVQRACAESVPASLWPASGPVVVAAGRLAGVKNYPLLLEAMAQLSEAPPVHLRVLGDGVERASLERRVESLGLQSRVAFVGFQRNPWPFMARADVFALTSSYEGFGNVIVEAMACGTPVVATRSPGTVDLIDHEANGLLVEHDPAAVAGAIRRLLEDPDLSAAIVARANADVARYTLPAVTARYARLFEEPDGEPA